MRKALTVFTVLAALVIGTSALVQGTTAGFTTCTYKCICSVPHKCCTTNGVTSCKPAPNGPLQCTQRQNC